MNLCIFIPKQPVKIIDLIDQSLDLVFVASNEFGSISSLQILIFHLNIHNFWPINFFQLKNLLPKSTIFIFQLSKFFLIAISQSFVVIELVFKFIMFIIIRTFKFIDLIFKECNLWGIIFLKSLNFNELLVWIFLFGVL